MKKLWKNKLFSKKAILLLLLLAALFPVVISLIIRNPKYILKIGVFILIYIIAISGLDILYGYCGQISMGHAGFFAIGAYGCAIVTDKLHLPILVSMLIAGVIAILVAIIVSYPATKLKFHFLSLATIAFGEIIYAFVQASPNEITGNFKGYFPKPLEIFGVNFSKNYIFYYYFVLLLVILFLIMKTNIVKSKIGRSFIAIRENPVAANGMGINVRRYKMLAFCISAFYVSISGSLYAHFVNYISPGLFAYDQSVSFMTMLLFGGSGNILGPIVGVVSIQVFNELLRNFDKYQMLFYGVLILVVVLFMPNGITGLKKQIEAIKNRKREEL